MLFNLVQQILWEVTGSDSPAWDIGLWTAASLDALLWVGLVFLVAQALWRAGSRR